MKKQRGKHTLLLCLCWVSCLHPLSPSLELLMCRLSQHAELQVCCLKQDTPLVTSCTKLGVQPAQY